jgi:hypothetical protein
MSRRACGWTMLVGLYCNIDEMQRNDEVSLRRDMTVRSGRIGAQWRVQLGNLDLAILRTTAHKCPVRRLVGVH